MELPVIFIGNSIFLHLIILTKQEFKNIFDLNFDNVRNYIYYRCGDTDLATDIAQEAFMKIWEKQLDVNQGKTKALLFKISSNIFISKYRKQQTELKFALSEKPQIQSQNPEDILQYKELQNNYNKVLTIMPEKQRVAFLMHRFDGCSYNEIAEKLGLSVKAIEKRMKLALDFLRKNIKN